MQSIGITELLILLAIPVAAVSVAAVIFVILSVRSRNRGNDGGE